MVAAPSFPRKRNTDDPRRARHRSLRAHDAPGVLRGADERHRGVRALRAQNAAAPQFPARGGPGAGAAFSRPPALHRRRAAMAGGMRSLHARVRRIARRSLLYRRRRRTARRHGVLRRRADPAHRRAVARGAAGREPGDEPRPLPDRRREQGRAVGAGCARPSAGRFRPAPRARRGSGAPVGARELSRRVYRDRDGGSRPRVRHSAVRHDGPFVCASARRRERRRSIFSRARIPKTPCC